ncbi:unnamed protein product [Ilex paraguariensis]|uniref:Uncharacterized protein n=1 Tax=Ilex paraguariensis TaxID=185542 RepID=A0ABC8SKV4_9AQUA
MLSIENPLPDPACPCEISQLKSSDERASDKLALQEVDLFKSGLDDHNPLPKFSIRDYVFRVRSKDIKTNWPFTQKNLQLCLNHGLTDLLPPFQPLDPVRSQSTKRCTVECRSLDNETISIPNGEPSRRSNNLGSQTSDDAGRSQKLAVDCVHINTSGSDGDKEFQSKATVQSPSEIDSVPTNRSPYLELETDTLLESLEAKVEPAAPPESHKIESTVRHPVKKCRLIFKLSSVADPSSKEDSAPTNLMVSETMASKVCPVCKNFSSSSNTTLNAHIDQCLSVASNVNWTANSKVVKHRIKPRKTRLMVDIYATAPYCTLEELDRRNGTNWATNSSFPAQEIELCAEEEEQKVSPVTFEDTDNEDGVYIDANGTKVRILSKFSNVSPVLKLADNPGPSKLLKGGNGSKFLSTKKKKSHKHREFLKLAPQSKAFGSPKPRGGFEVLSGQKRDFAAEVRQEKNGRCTQRFKAQEQLELNDPGTIRQWVGSKRSCLTKKTSVKDDLQRSRYNVTQELLVESDQCPLYVERSCVPKSPTASENPVSSPLSNKKIETSSYEPQTDEYEEQPAPRKKIGFSSMGSRVHGDGKTSLVLPNQTVKQLRKDGTYLRGGCKGHKKHTGKHGSSPSNMEVEMSAGPPKSSDSSIFDLKLSNSHHALSSKAKKFSSLRKNLLSVNQASVPECKSNFKRKSSAPKKSLVHCISKFDKDVVAWQSKVDQQHDLIQKKTEKRSLGTTGVLKIKKKRIEVNISREEEAMSLKSSSFAPECHGNDVGENIDSSARVSSALVDTSNDVEHVRSEVQTPGKDDVTEPVASMAVRESFMGLGKSLHPGFHELDSPGAQYDSLHGIEVYRGRFCGAEASICPNESGFGNGHGMICGDVVGNVVIGENTHMETVSDSKDGEGSYLPEVDPILIPGPPGSYLPSPGGTDSDDLQGNSSLTTSMVQSSEDNHDVVDRDSSDSPISETSTVSSSAVARSDSKSSELSVGQQAVKDEIRTSFSGASVDPSMENSIPFPQAVNLGKEKINLEDLRTNVLLIDKGPLSFKYDQPCCCSRKEAASQGFALNYQDSPLLRRRTTASLPLTASGKQMICDPNTRHNSLNSRSEMFSLSNYPTSATEKVAIPTLKSPAGHVPVTVSADSEVKFPIDGDHDSGSPSVSNSVLRLMGKNLMVVNKDGDASPKLRQSQSQMMNDHAKPQFCSVSGVPPCNVQNKGCNPVNHVVSRSSFVFNQNQLNTAVQPFDVTLSNSSRSHVDFKTPQTNSRASEAMFSVENVATGFTASSDGHDCKVGPTLPTEQNRPENRLDPLVYNVEKIAATPASQHRNANSTSNPAKEIIIIDDTPESETDLASDANFNSGVINSWEGSSAGMSIPMASIYNSRHVNPFYGYQPQLSSPYGGSPMVYNAGFQMLNSGGVNVGPVRWNCTAEGTRIPHPSSLTASSSSTGHRKSTSYYAPRFA